MRFKEFGAPTRPVVIFLHGAGLSWWGYQKVAARMSGDYHVVLPIIDGYGEDADEPFESIEQSAQNLIRVITERYGGRVLVLGGLSLGAQIVAEVLSQKPHIADYAVLESALVCPMPATKALAAPMVRMSYGLIRRRWFAKAQAKALMVPDELFEDYFADSRKITKQSLINTLISNGTYHLKAGIAQTTAKTLILAGEKEAKVMLRSARALHDAIPGSELYIAPNRKHGELSMAHPSEFVRRVMALLAR